MDLVCYLIDDHPVDIRPARNRREWMDQTPGSYAYRCLPLSIANAHGWEVCCPGTCEAEWKGGPAKGDIHLVFEDEGENATKNEKADVFAESHFGSGILTFNMGVIMKTPPGYDLWITGPTNEFKDGIQAMSAVIESYWMPFSFTMNWKFTRPNLKIRFEQGEPFCTFFPIEHGLLERVNPSFEHVVEGSDLERQYKSALYRRALLIPLEKRKGKELKGKDRFDGWYIRGEMPDGTRVANHTTRLEVKPFTMEDGSRGR